MILISNYPINYSLNYWLEQKSSLHFQLIKKSNWDFKIKNYWTELIQKKNRFSILEL